MNKEKELYYLYIDMIDRNDVLTEEQKKEQQKVIESITKKAEKYFGLERNKND